MVDIDVSSDRSFGEIHFLRSINIIDEAIAIFFVQKHLLGDPTFFTVCLPKFLTIHYHLDW